MSICAFALPFPLPSGTRYVITVEASNGCDAYSASSSTNGFMFDTVAPTSGGVRDGDPAIGLPSGVDTSYYTGGCRCRPHLSMWRPQIVGQCGSFGSALLSPVDRLWCDRAAATVTVCTACWPVLVPCAQVALAPTGTRPATVTAA